MRPLLTRVIDAAGALAGAFVFAIFFVMLAATVMRTLGMRTGGTDDVVSWMTAAAAFFGLAHTFRHGDFVRVTLLLEKMGPAQRRRFELLSLCIGAAATAYLAWWACRFTYESWEFNDLAQGLLPLPLWIPQLSFAFGAVLLFVAMLDELLIVLRGGRPTFVVAVEERHAHGDFSADV